MGDILGSRSAGRRASEKKSFTKARFGHEFQARTHQGGSKSRKQPNSREVPRPHPSDLRKGREIQVSIALTSLYRFSVHHQLINETFRSTLVLSRRHSPFLYFLSIVDIDKKKYLVPSDLTCGQFIYVVRRRLHLPPEQAIYLFCSNGVIPSSSSLMSSLYQDHGDPDGFLYMKYTGENVFGGTLLST
jgi:hypothetical protein